jgi:hypothetical protein
MIRFATVVLLAALPLAVMPGTAHADDRTCNGTIKAVSVDGSVIVPQDATCTLLGTRVGGNVDVKKGATLVARGVRVGGNIQAENHRSVVVVTRTVNEKVVRSQIGGSIQLKQGGGGRLLKNVVGSDVQLFTNDARFEVRGNRIDGNLQCKDNSPAPVGADNVVQGSKEDQCKNL